MKNRFTAKRIAINAVLVALYIGLSMFSFILGGVKITLEGLPVVICAIVFGPIDAVIVGFLGEFVNQMLTFGFTTIARISSSLENFHLPYSFSSNMSGSAL